MRAATLRVRARLQQPVEKQDAYGDSVPEWKPFVPDGCKSSTVWCEVAPASGLESLSGDQTIAQVTHVVTTRWLGGLKPKMRLVIGDRVFYIAAVIRDRFDRKISLRMPCIEKVD